MKLNSVADIKNCYGCGVCVAACPHHLLELKHDENGFYAPRITHNSACIDCGICRNVCSFLDTQLSVIHETIDWKAAWSSNADVLSNCSSGGIAFEIAAKALDLGYEVIGVRYDCINHRAEHCVCTTIEQLKSTRGSKYIQSYTPSAFAQLKKNKKYLIIGTPCQIDSLRRFIKRRKIEANIILIDFFCHGVPSYWVWKKYLKENFGNLKLRTLDFRSKLNSVLDEVIPWSNSFCVTGYGYDNTIYQPSIGKRDWFYHYFLSDLCLGKACYNHCKYKMYRSAADIRLGDAWGSTYKDNKYGVSAILLYTKKGQELFNKCSNLNIDDIDIELLCEGQMRQSPEMPPKYSTRLWLLKYTPLGLQKINRIINFLTKIGI